MDSGQGEALGKLGLAFLQGIIVVNILTPPPSQTSHLSATMAFNSSILNLKHYFSKMWSSGCQETWSWLNTGPYTFFILQFSVDGHDDVANRNTVPRAPPTKPPNTCLVELRLEIALRWDMIIYLKTVSKVPLGNLYIQQAAYTTKENVVCNHCTPDPHKERKLVGLIGCRRELISEAQRETFEQLRCYTCTTNLILSFITSRLQFPLPLLLLAPP